MGVLAITGVSGFLGQSLLRALERTQKPERIVGIDIRFPAFNPPWLAFYNFDVREEVLTNSLQREQVEQVVHLANPQVPMRDERLRRQILVGGAKNVLRACANAGASHLVVLSSTAVYGPRDELDAALKEDAPLHGHPRFAFARDTVKVELLCEEFASRYPQLPITVLRPGVVLGPQVNNFWARFLLKTPVLPRVKARGAPLQFLHLEDLVAAMLLALDQRRPGAFNIVGKGKVALERAGEILGKKVVWVPAVALYPLFEASYQLHFPGVEVPSAVLDFLLNPPLVDGERAARELGFTPKFEAEAALTALVRDPPR